MIDPSFMGCSISIRLHQLSNSNRAHMMHTFWDPQQLLQQDSLDMSTLLQGKDMAVLGQANGTISPAGMQHIQPEQT